MKTFLAQPEDLKTGLKSVILLQYSYSASQYNGLASCITTQKLLYSSYKNENPINLGLLKSDI